MGAKCRYIAPPIAKPYKIRRPGSLPNMEVYMLSITFWHCLSEDLMRDKKSSSPDYKGCH
jgi:hypothetical protein